MFENTESIINDPLRFKVKLAIGEDAYTSLRLKNKVYDAWDAIGVAGTAATVVQSSAVATTFFAPTGFMAVLGFGTAVTPIGWVLAAAVISGGTWAGVSRYVKKQSNDKVTVIPTFINTPMDVLALGLFDLMAPLALKIADVDGKIDKSEKKLIEDYFVNEWGYTQAFVKDAMSITEANLGNFSIKDLASSIAKFQKENPDCNYTEMTSEMIRFLNEVIEADGIIDEREEMAIERIENIFNEADKVNVVKKVKSGIDCSSKFVKSIFMRQAK